MYLRTGNSFCEWTSFLGIGPSPTPQSCSSVPPCLVGPCLTHFHEDRTCPGGALSHRFSGKFFKMCPEFMNPGFIDLSTGKAINNDELDKALHDRLSSDYKDLKGKYSVALVDLTGNKLCRPEFAGVNETDQFFGASVPKIAILFAAFQLQSDLQALAIVNRITTGNALTEFARVQWETELLPRRLQPKLDQLFDFVPNPNSVITVSMKPELQDLLCCTFKDDYSCNRTASILMTQIGLPYISSVLWQSGLFHRKTHGLWLQWYYSMKKDCPAKCTSDVDCFPATGNQTCNSLFPKVTRNFEAVRKIDITKLFRDVSGQNVTALSAAAYFTLLAQFRLVSRQASICIKKLLSSACSFFLAPRDDADRGEHKCKGFRAGIPITREDVAVKCGATRTPVRVAHDCVLVERTIGSTGNSSRKLRYVVILLTKNASVKGGPLIGMRAICFFRNRLLPDLDDLILNRNP